MKISCHNYPEHNKWDSQYYPDNDQSMCKTLKMALKRTEINSHFLIKQIFLLHPKEDPHILISEK